MGTLKNNAKNETKAYTVEELEDKLKSIESRISFIQKRIGRITAFRDQLSSEYSALLAKKEELESELKHYTGFVSSIMFAIKSALSGTENLSKSMAKELGTELDNLQKLIDEKFEELQQFEQVIASNEASIEKYQAESKRWQTKLNKRKSAAEPDPQPHELGDI